MRIRQAGAAIACGMCFLLGAVLSPTLGPRAAADGKSGADKRPAFPMSARLGSNLYQQTSAEHRAVCLQTYRCAQRRLAEILSSLRPSSRPPAIVMDLDETVLDNSSFQTYLLKNGLEFSDDKWARYEEQHAQDVRLVPGARQFIQYARRHGVTVLFLSNRTEKFRDSTLAALAALDLDCVDVAEHLYLRPRDSKSEKASRREQIAARYKVFMLFGDNLRDFSEAFAAPSLPENTPLAEVRDAIQSRKCAVDAATHHWGIDWFVIPNPAYGEWDHILGDTPIAVLNPKSME